MAKVLWIPLKSLKLCKSPLDLSRANQYDINKGQNKLNEDERLEKWVFFLLWWLFFSATFALVDWVTGCVLTGWLLNKMGTAYMGWIRSFYSLSVTVSFINVGFNQVVKMLTQLKFGNLILSLTRFFKYPLHSQQNLIKISRGVSFSKLLSLLLNCVQK